MRTRKIFPTPTNSFKKIEVLLNLPFKVHDLTIVKFITNFGSITKGVKSLNSVYLLVATRFNG